MIIIQKYLSLQRLILTQVNFQASLKLKNKIRCDARLTGVRDVYKMARRNENGFGLRVDPLVERIVSRPLIATV